MFENFTVGDRVRLTHPTRTDKIGNHLYKIVNSDACHYYVIDTLFDNGSGIIHKVRLDSVKPIPGVEYAVQSEA